MSDYWVYWDRPLGKGGEGSVYLSYSYQGNRLLAIKFSNSNIPWMARTQLSQELSRALRVSGKHIMRPVSWNLDSTLPFLVYEFAANGTLKDEILEFRRKGLVYHPALALNRTREILLGVVELHGSGQIHRDVKPDNILKFGGNELRLNDLGLGRTLNRPYSQQTRPFQGTPTYCSPEQYWGRSVDQRSDLYSVGAILYEMLMGYSPNGVAGPLPSPAFRWKNVLPSLELFLWSLLATDPRYRPFSARAALALADNVIREYRIWRSVFKSRGLESPY